VRAHGPVVTNEYWFGGGPRSLRKSFTAKNTAERHADVVTLLQRAAKKPAEAFERPSCTTCNLDMWLIRAEPHAVLTANDVWSFECPDCKTTKELTVDRWRKTPPP
jgi:hypothetical protein